MRDSSLSAPEFKTELKKKDALNSDIQETLQSSFPKAVEQTKEFAKKFAGGSKLEEAKRVWTFLKKYVAYQKDPDHNQIIRLPSRFVYDGNGDCKSYSLFAAAILTNLGFDPVKFRFANYNYSNIPTHVYVVTQDEKGNEIIVDGVWNEFNSEKKPAYKFDKQMNVYTISGVNQPVGILKKFRKKLKKTLKKIQPGKLLKKVGLAPARRAYRTLVALNMLGLATKLNRANQKNPNAVKQKWEKLGGKYSELLKSIKAGAKRKRIGTIEGLEGHKHLHHFVRHEHPEFYNAFLKRHLKHKISGIGVAPVAAPSLLAVAAPIITALAGLLKALGGDKKDSGESSVDKITDMAQQAAKQSGFYSGGGGGGAGADINPDSNPSAFETQANESDEPGSSFQISTPILIGGAALAAFLLLKKKK